MFKGFEDDFFTGIEENPFEDPSVTQITTNATNLANTGGEASSAFPGPPVSNQPTNNVNNIAPAPQVVQQPPAYTKSGQQTQNNFINDYERRGEELDRKERELAQREAAYTQAPSASVRANNWPPLPNGFCLTPCFYIDIEVEIRLEFQRILRHLYHLWIMHGCLLVLNVLGTFGLLLTYADFSSFGVSIIYLILFAPLSFLCWYRPVYKAFRNDSSFQFMVFFFVFFFQFLTTTFMAVGILGSGSCGLLKAIGCFTSGGPGGTVMGIIVLCISLGFASCAALELYLLAKMLVIYRGSGASLSKATTEFTSEILKNQTVRNVASDVAAHQINQQFNNSSNTNSSRY